MPNRFYAAEECCAKAEQHWEMAGLARQDGDQADAKRQTELAQLWDQRAREGGWEDSTQEVQG